tara:strand:+ start:768 stop:1322 length:555 start_codon:yes stop_codon:yes gene_type:complete
MRGTQHMTKFNLVITGPETAMGETIMQAQKLGCTVSDISMLTQAVEAAPVAAAPVAVAAAPVAVGRASVEVKMRSRQQRRHITKATYDALGKVKRVLPTSQDLREVMNKDGISCDRACVSSALSRLSAMGLITSPDAPNKHNRRWRIKSFVDQAGYDDAAKQYSQFYSPKQLCASNGQHQLSLQ